MAKPLETYCTGPRGLPASQMGTCLFGPEPVPFRTIAYFYGRCKTAAHCPQTHPEEVPTSIHSF